MRRKLEFMLRCWGDHYIRHGDHADELGENILYAAGIVGGRVQDASSSASKVLCEERSKTVRQVDRAVNKLDFAQKRAIRGWYCTGLREDGNPHTKAQIAMKLRTSKASFEISLGQAKKNILYELTGCS
jgi:hypothetical protein